MENRTKTAAERKWHVALLREINISGKNELRFPNEKRALRNFGLCN